MFYKIKRGTLSSIADTIKDYYPSSSISVEAFPQAIRDGANSFIDGTFIENNIDERGYYEFPSGVSKIRPYFLAESTSSICGIGGNEVEEIGSYAFSGCSNLSKISFPNCKTFKDYCFGYYTMNASVPFLSKCESIGSYNFANFNRAMTTDLVFPELKYLGYGNFGSFSLKSISFPKLQYIEANAFASIHGSAIDGKELVFLECLSIGGQAFGWATMSGISLPKCQTVNNSAFFGCGSLKTISLPSLISLGSQAFRGCTGLEYAYLKYPSPSSTFGSYVFSNCGNLRSVDFIYDSSYNYLPDIPAGLFYANIRLSRINLSEFGNNIGAYAFAYCASLKSFSAVAKGNPQAWYRHLYSYAFAGCTSLEEVNIKRITSIYSNAFANCSKLRIVFLPSVDYIGSYAFQYAFSNTAPTVDFNFSSLTEIGSSAFQHCMNFDFYNMAPSYATSAKYFKGLEKIYPYAFFRCQNLTNLYFKDIEKNSTQDIFASVNTFTSCWRLRSIYLDTSTVYPMKQNPASIFVSTPFTGYSSFVSDPKIYVRTSLVAAYQSATNWSALSSYITGYDF